MKWLAAGVLVVVALTGCDGNSLLTGPPAVPLRAAVALPEWLPYTQDLPNFCTGELLHLAGEYREVAGVTLDGSGGQHLIVNSVDHVTAVGDISGAEYVGNETINRVLNVAAPLPFVGTISHHFTLAGRSDRLVFSFLERITVNANGEVTVDRTDYSLGCR